QFFTYSDPGRDPRMHTISTVYLARAEGEPRGGDDAKDARAFCWDALPPLAFDHGRILEDVRRYLTTGRRPRPAGGGRRSIAVRGGSRRWASRAGRRRGVD